jgi:hypothetical protein
MPRVLLDNDVVLKIACYSLEGEMLAATTIEGAAPGMLGVGKYVIGRRLDRAGNIADVKRAKAAFDRLLSAVMLLEPAAEELEMAAELEAEANRQDLDLDGGESQLLAILTVRACRLLITGDKRAVVAKAAIAPGPAARRIGCLEQLIAELIRIGGAGHVRSRVCAEPEADRAIAICCGCSQAAVDQEQILAGLSSYVGHLDSSAPGVLLSGIDFTSLAT